MTDGTGTSTYSYDEAGLLVANQDGSGQSTGYSYDAAGQLTGLQYATGITVSRSYDPAGRMTSMSDGRGATTTFGYDPDGDLTVQSDGNGIVQTSSYDAEDAQVSTTDTAPRLGAVATYAVTRNPDEQVTNSNDTVLGIPDNNTYTYTLDNQIGSDNTGAYGYDPAGNLTAQPGGTSQSYDAADELTSQTRTIFGFGLTTTYGYNADGDRTSATTGRTTTGYSYDQADRLTATTTDSTTDAYNGDGLRTMTTTFSGAHQFTYDLTSDNNEILTDGTNSYLYGPTGHVIEQINTKTGQVLYLGQDQLGSTRLITNKTGQIAGVLNYDPYGNPQFRTGLQQSYLTPIGYAGAYTNTTTGLLYLINRYYDPSTATFGSAARMGDTLVRPPGWRSG